MVQTVDVFVDSSVLVEYIKQNRTDLLDFLTEKRENLAIGNIVVSEFLFYFVGFRGNKSPMTLKRDGSIDAILKQYNPVSILKDFSIVSETTDVMLVISLMQKHNLLPNDALILATCLHHSLPYLASYDENDFRDACTAEEITLISSVEEAKQYLSH